MPGYVGWILLLDVSLNVFYYLSCYFCASFMAPMDPFVLLIFVKYLTAVCQRVLRQDLPLKT